MEWYKQVVAKIIFGGGIIFDLAKWLILLLIILTIVTTFFVSAFVVDGLSMEPNLHDNELVLWDKKSYQDKKPDRGDVVVMNYPGDPKKKKYVKRIIGLPGERIDIYNGYVYVNKKLYKEKYISLDTPTAPEGTWNLEPDQYFLLGDNRPNSNDSRYFGPVERRFLLGKGIAIIWPRIWVIEAI